jgi:uncharacterized membrane protein YdjX (TVP38/TMEM64 family)
MSSRSIFTTALVVLLGAAMLFAYYHTNSSMPLTEEWVKQTVGQLGVAGPVALVALMGAAIVLSPIPSGPIAVAAGALYGTLWGGAFTILGAVGGAMIAFGLARYLGFDAVRRSSSPVLRYIAAPRSEGALMLIVFASRLVPFISFDAVSYAAGITCLSFWRFALATVLGVVPVSFALSAVGDGMIGSTTDGMQLVVVGGAITLVPVALHWGWRRITARRNDSPD